MNVLKLSLAAGLVSVAACATNPAPKTDPRIGLKAGMFDAAEAVSNLKVTSKLPPPDRYKGATNSDLAFVGNYAIQGNYNGILIWDISNPTSPTLKTSFFCPASQNDVSVTRNLMFVSSEANYGRLDCGDQGVRDTVSHERFRGIRIFDITDIMAPKLVAQVQTCRGSHTHTVLEDPKDKDNVYVYVSGSAGIRSPNELAGCVRDVNDPSTAYFRIEVIKVPVNNPAAAAIVGSPRFFENLVAPQRHGLSSADSAQMRQDLATAKAKGCCVVVAEGQERPVAGFQIRFIFDSLARARGDSGKPPTRADSVWVQANLQRIFDAAQAQQRAAAAARGPNPLQGRGPTQCHDITVYPALGRAGGACEGYGFLLDISDPVKPFRIDAVSDSNFSYWHSATFNNDGTKILFSDEWGGGGGPKCRAGDPKEWGADAIFTVEPGNKMKFRSYYKLSAIQTSFENCVAHNGSLIPIPDRDIMVQSWYQGGVSLFDWTDPDHPTEIAYFDRGPSDSTRQGPGGTWSAYWYNGTIYSSEIARGFDVMEMTPSEHVTQNEIDAAKTVRFDHLNVQGQPRFIWPPTFALARAYVDQLERSKCWDSGRVTSVRGQLATAEAASGSARRDALQRVATDVEAARGSCGVMKITKLATTARALAGIQP